jgi:4-hydroxybenzoate polyprenyltransferase
LAVRDWLRLARVPLAPTAAFDAVACALLARAGGFSRPALPWPTPASLAALAATSLLVYAAGMAGNDLADRRRDAVLAPDRPLPAGRIGPGAAWAFVLGGAGLAVAIGGGPDGDRRAVGAALLLAFAYDFALKRSVAAGALAMGLVRTCNAATAVLPLVLDGRTAPAALLPPVAVGLYSAAVTVLSTTEELRSRARALVARLLALLAFLGAAALSAVGAGGWSLGTILAASVVVSLAFGRVPRPGPVKRQVLEMLLGLYFLSASLAAGADARSPAVGLVAFGAAFALVFLSQVAIRALRPRAAGAG